MNSFILETPRLRNIDEILESDKPIEDNAFKNMVNDPEFDEAINEIFEGLRETDEWNDLIDYYIALEYIFGVSVGKKGPTLVGRKGPILAG